MNAQGSVRTLEVRSLIDAVATDLRRLVVEAELDEGQPLTEAFVAAQYDVARPTAKAAIERLVGEGVLIRTTNKTARVVVLGPDDARDIYRTRVHIESEVLRRLARARIVPAESVAANDQIRRRAAAMLAQGTSSSNADSAIVGADMAFHTHLVDALGSPRTSRMYASLAFEVTLCMARLQGTHLLPSEVIVAEHQQILTFLAAGDEDAVADLLEEHLSRPRELLVGALGGRPGPEAVRPCRWLQPA